MMMYVGPVRPVWPM